MEAENVEVEVETALKNQQTLTCYVNTPRKKTLKASAVRLTGFLFWSNLTAFISLVIGCFAPGWLTVGRTDYSLWHVTKCYPASGLMYLYANETRCETIPYHVIARQPSIVHADLGYMDFVQAETLYCVGMILSFATLIKFYQRRQKVARGICDELHLKKWVLFFTLAALSAVLILFPVGMFRGTKEKRTYVSPLSGIVIAGLGGAVMALTAISMLLCFPALPCTYFQFSNTNEPV